MENASIVILRFRPYIRAIQVFAHLAMMIFLYAAEVIGATVALAVGIGGLVGSLLGKTKVEIGPAGVQVALRACRPWSEVEIRTKRGREWLALGTGRFTPGIVFAQFTKDWRNDEIGAALRHHVPRHIGGPVGELRRSLGVIEESLAPAPPGYVHYVATPPGQLPPPPSPAP